MMKKWMMIPALAVSLFACDEAVDGDKLAREVCDCYNEARVADDPAAASTDCNELNTRNTEKVLGTDAYVTYMDRLNNCEGE